MVNSTDCILDASPVRPEPISNSSISLALFEIYDKTKVHLNISWKHPTATYGYVASYEVIVTKEPLNEMDNVDMAVPVIYRNSETLSLNVSLNHVNDH